MDITQENFKERLLDILANIASSDFVTLDLLVSGKPPRTADTPNRDNRQTLQARYDDTRAAAQRFQVLQLGITCVQESDDQPTQTFLLRTYNIDVSPLVTPNLDLDRFFDCQSTTLSAAARTGFDMGVALESGARYLSRAEESAARARIENKAMSEAEALPDIVLDASHADDRAFVDRVRDEVHDWLGLRKCDECRPASCFRVVSRTRRWKEVGPLGVSRDERLGARERRLVCQMLRDLFPGVVARKIAGGSLLVGVRGVEGEEGAARERRVWLGRRKVGRGVGMRWVVEALVGGQRLRGIRVDDLPGDPKENAARLEEVVRLLAEKRPVLVGHGLFEDVIYLCENFLWELPATVDEFAGMVGDVWPMVVDTRYMASQWFTADGAEAASLRQVEEALCEQEEPIICELS